MAHAAGGPRWWWPWVWPWTTLDGPWTELALDGRRGGGSSSHHHHDRCHHALVLSAYRLPTLSATYLSLVVCVRVGSFFFLTYPPGSPSLRSFLFCPALMIGISVD